MPILIDNNALKNKQNRYSIVVLPELYRCKLKKRKIILDTFINRIDIKRTYRVLEQLDKEVFIIEFDVNYVKSGILKSYIHKNPNKINL